MGQGFGKKRRCVQPSQVGDMSATSKGTKHSRPKGVVGRSLKKPRVKELKLGNFLFGRSEEILTEKFNEDYNIATEYLIGSWRGANARGGVRVPPSDGPAAPHLIYKHLRFSGAAHTKSQRGP